MEAITSEEQRRLAALESYNILDTPREQDFDDIAALAASLCDTPIAVVNLIGDGRQFFKAEVGLGVRTTPLDTSFCAHAILEQDLLIIPDTLEDPRFNCNPLVTSEPHIRFYAGALLKSDDGLPIGTICVLGHEAKELSKAQKTGLQALARQVMSLLELRRNLHTMSHDLALERRLSAKRQIRASKADAKAEELLVNDARSKAAHDAGRIGIFEVDIATNDMIVSEEFCRIYGVPVQRQYSTQVFQNLIIDEDKKLASEAISQGDGTAPLSIEYRIRRGNDQRVRWVARRAQFIEDETGKSVKIIGIIIDVTDSKRKDARIAALLTLGDRLRVGKTVEDISRIASEILAEGLAVNRAGYATVNSATSGLFVEYNWLASGVNSIAGHHTLGDFSATIERLEMGDTLAVPNINAASWLDKDAASYSAIGVRSFVKVPVIDRGSLVGILFAHDSKPRFWSKLELDFAWGVADRAYAAIARLNAESEQRLLNQELSHRLKNTLSIVQAIAAQTLRNVTEKDAVAAFNGRLHALSSAHDVLLQQSWSTARLRDVIRKVMHLHASSEKVLISGPDVPLGPKAGLSLSLLLHELGTNAIKYGSLSTDTGVVDISWDVSEETEKPMLTLKWEEKGGPPAREPERKGFGSRLIRMGIAGTGDVDKHFTNSGLIATFRAPLSLVTELGE
ncbi:HWE histidine kinase domain-containing protein [Agrobacterium rubi]|uniref:Blue-light-activated histidine kinase n=1 Tax=Agrobacterium rubi TaxID=28099 RepID=A0AAE7URV2_9HYPH|nr:HWE histidine kinase domain-containing protein [Agrobacterium rubi]NTE85887.1 GAF domain-containing protein [Agrobacterium rubi]NTF01818.1 GAF domain-containing protein [Agrobacterium rubi]NTF36062.1 GAF domain-containing protein [Agrobacterium rubi]OCJ54749.1 histidine kinase [Agrobacterium rubi]QTG01150.1 GAF domain-containing protein [Agrobacterium rubi]